MLGRHESFRMRAFLRHRAYRQSGLSVSDGKLRLEETSAWKVLRTALYRARKEPLPYRKKTSDH
ncbi:Uncharacterized protein DAT39_004908, partial [Clarias magur]